MAVEALIEQLKTIPDWRRGGRQVQYPLWLMLLMSLLGVMSGYSLVDCWLTDKTMRPHIDTSIL
jgi:hypothetical protein